MNISFVSLRSAVLLFLMALMFAIVGNAKAQTSLTPTAKVTQSSIMYGLYPERALDGDIATFNHTRDRANVHWLELELENTANLSSVQVTNRNDHWFFRLKEFYILASEKPFGTRTLDEILSDSSVSRVYRETAPAAGETVIFDELNGVQAKYVRIQLANPAESVAMHIAEIDVLGEFSTGNDPERTNIALNSTAEASSVGWNGFPKYAVDGDLDGYASTDNHEFQQWMQFDLGRLAAIDDVQIFSRKSHWFYQISDVHVLISKTPFGDRSLDELLADPEVYSDHYPYGFYGSMHFFAGQQGVEGRYVRVQEASGKHMAFAELQVFGEFIASEPEARTNIALNARAEASSVGWGGYPERAVDGNIDSNASTNTHEQHQWMQFDLGRVAEIDEVQIFSQNNQWWYQLNNFYVLISSKPFGTRTLDELLADPEVSYAHYASNFFGKMSLLTDQPTVQGRYIRIQDGSDSRHFAFAELKVFGEFVEPVPEPREHIALNTLAEASSVGWGGYPEKAVDGDLNSLAITNTHEQQQWVQVDLGRVAAIDEVAVTSNYGGHWWKISNFHVLISKKPFGTRTLDALLADPEIYSEHYASNFYGTMPFLLEQDAVEGRYIRIQEAGEDRHMLFSEMKVFGEFVEPAPEERASLALNAHAEASSVGWGGYPEKAVDGDLNSLAITNTHEQQQWVQIDLGRVAAIDEVALTSNYGGHWWKISNFHVLISKKPFGTRTLDALLADPEIYSEHYASNFYGTMPFLLEQDAVEGRYIRIQEAGDDRHVLFSEMKVFGEFVEPAPEERANLALNALAVASSEGWGGYPEKAVDGDLNSFAITNTHEKQQWVQVDLGRVAAIDEVAVTSNYGGHWWKISNFHVLISKKPFGTRTLDALLADPEIYSEHYASNFYGTMPFLLEQGAVEGRYIRIQEAGEDNHLLFSEMEVFGQFVGLPPVERVNLALNAKVDASSVGWEGYPEKAVDGDLNTLVVTNNNEVQQWVQIDLGKLAVIDEIELVSHFGRHWWKISKFHILISKEPFGPRSLDELLADPEIYSEYYPENFFGMMQILLNESAEGRYIRIQEAGNDNHIVFSELKVFGDFVDTAAEQPINLALNKTTSASSIGWGGYDEFAVDGDISSWWSSSDQELQPWWQVDLGKTVLINGVEVASRQDRYWWQVNNFYVMVSEQPLGNRTLDELLADDAVHKEYYQGNYYGSMYFFAQAENVYGRYVRIQESGDSTHSAFTEVSVFGNAEVPFQAAEIISPQSSDVLQSTNTQAQIATGEAVSSIRVVIEQEGQQTNEFSVPLSATTITLPVALTGNPVTVSVFSTSAVDNQEYMNQYTYATNYQQDPLACSIAMQNPDGDADFDGLKNRQECGDDTIAGTGTDPNNPDTDGDGLDDGAEVDWIGADSANDSVSFSIGADSADERNLLHALNRLTYGANLELFERLYNEGDVRQNIIDWIGQQFDTPGTQVVIQGEVFNEKDRRYNKGHAFNHAVNLDIVDFVGDPKLNTFFTEYALGHVKHIAKEPHQCGNGLFKLAGYTGPNPFRPDEDIDTDAVDIELIGYAERLTNCLAGWLHICETEVNAAGEKVNDPAQCRREVQQAQTFNNADGDMRVSSILAAIRPVNSNQHLRSVVGDFWDNHFHTNFANGTIGSAVPIGGSAIAVRNYDVDTYFDNAFGNFYKDLLLKSAQSPAMLAFLNNHQSKAGSINENYAREVMELHTLGVDNVYTQDDIYQLARILTGWQIDVDNNGRAKPYHGRYKYYSWALLDNPRGAGARPTAKGSSPKNMYMFTNPSENDDYYWGAVSQFAYNDAAHDDGDDCPVGRDEDYCKGNKIFLDFEIGQYAQKSNKNLVRLTGQAEGEFALQALAHHPWTAVRMCNKLYNKFYNDAQADYGDGQDNVVNAIEINYTPVANEQEYLSEDPAKRSPYKSASFSLNSVKDVDRIVASCAQTYWAHRHSPSQMQLVLKNLFVDNIDAFLSQKYHRLKSKDAMEFGYSIYRIFNKDTSSLLDEADTNIGVLVGTQAMDRVQYAHPDPDGLPESTASWTNFNQVRGRLGVATFLPGSHWSLNNGFYHSSPGIGTKHHGIAREGNADGIGRNHFTFRSLIDGAVADLARSTSVNCFIQYNDDTPRGWAERSRLHFCVTRYKDAGQPVSKAVARHLMRMVFGGYYTGADVQMIYELINHKYILDEEGINTGGVEYRYGHVPFDVPYGYHWRNEYGKIQRLNALGKAIITVSDLNLQ